MAHSAKYSLGLSKIEFATILGTGGTGTSWSALGQTGQDSCVLSTDDPEITEFFCEESDTAVVTSSKAGKTTLKFNVIDPDIETLTTLMGGTSSGTAPSRVWNAPATLPTIEKSIKITPKQGFASVVIPRASIVAKLNTTFGKKDLLKVEVTATVLTPTLAGVDSILIAE